MLLLKPDKMAIIVLHELTHILMQSPAGNAYTFCCENVGKIIKVFFNFYFSILGIMKQAEAIAQVENDRKRKSKKGEHIATAPINSEDMV